MNKYRDEHVYVMSLPSFYSNGASIATQNFMENVFVFGIHFNFVIVNFTVA